MEQETTFYEGLQNASDLDLRDARGLRHDLALVLVGLTIALLRRRDGRLSSVHRSMVNTHEQLCEALSIDKQPVVSRSHLPRILGKVNLGVFEKLIFARYGITLNQQERQWFSGDGKELRGSIEKGNKRGEVCVQLVRHEDRKVLGQSFYNGTKESERPCLQALVEATAVHQQGFTGDALHLHPKMTNLIHQAGGGFVIGIKDNQKEMLQDMIRYAKHANSGCSHHSVDKGHGRLEVRQYDYFDVRGEYFDKRWDKSGLCGLIQVSRTCNTLKNNEVSQQLSYYITNQGEEKAQELFTAVRNHWSVEVNNHYRDVTLREDQLRTKKSLSPRSWQPLERSSWKSCVAANLVILSL